MGKSARNIRVSRHHANSIHLRLTSIESLESRLMLAGDLIARFRADDLNDTLEDGATISHWEDSIGQIQAVATGQPQLVKNAFGAHSAIRLNAIATFPSASSD